MGIVIDSGRVEIEPSASRNYDAATQAKLLIEKSTAVVRELNSAITTMWWINSSCLSGLHQLRAEKVTCPT
jgi:hypothetical protein